MTIAQLRQYRKLKGALLLLCAENQNSVGESEEQIKQRENDAKSIQGMLNAIENYIDKSDFYYRDMLKQHYIKGKKWLAIAMQKGGGNTAESVRKECHRYIKKHPFL